MKNTFPGAVRADVNSSDNLTNSGASVSAFDPDGIIWHFLNEDERQTGTAPREALFVWLMGLPSGSEPSTAAAQLLDSYEGLLVVEENSDQGDLIAMLEQVRHFDRSQRSRLRGETSRSRTRRLH